MLEKLLNDYRSLDEPLQLYIYKRFILGAAMFICSIVCIFFFFQLAILLIILSAFCIVSSIYCFIECMEDKIVSLTGICTSVNKLKNSKKDGRQTIELYIDDELYVIFQNSGYYKVNVGDIVTIYTHKYNLLVKDNTTTLITNFVCLDTNSSHDVNNEEKIDNFKRSINYGNGKEK